MFLNIHSHRFLSRSLAMAFTVACGLSLSSVAQAQMAVGSTCTNCVGGSAQTVTYSSPATAQYSHPVTQHSYPAGTTVSHSYPHSVSSGCSSNRRCHSASRRSVTRYRQPSSTCGTTYSSTPVYSASSCSNGSCNTVNSYPTSGVTHVSTPVMRTGASCASGNCR
ncbi:hypothetical protein [Roseimaritima multifibrata]|uniref:hypothetical protein n=1 Tax=Roseimaritima multifibrata TaxID=1930274 RepID=UPI0011A2B0A4|nr:hypothetical protein [Roseimaritima multifibrata]